MYFYRYVVILTYEWSFLCGWQALSDGHEENCHGEQGGNTQSHLLPRL